MVRQVPGTHRVGHGHRMPPSSSETIDQDGASSSKVPATRPRPDAAAMTGISHRRFTGTAAKNYQRHFVPAIATPVSTGLLDVAALQPGERVLDVACGTGVITRLAAERVRVDRVGHRHRPRRRHDRGCHGNASTREPPSSGASDATSLPFGDEQFDAVLCQMGLMFMEDPSKATAEMRRVLAPGGRVVVNTPGVIQPPFALLEQAIVEHISADLAGFVRVVFSMRDPDAVAALLRRRRIA